MKENIFNVYKSVCRCVFNDVPAQAVFLLKGMIYEAEVKSGKDLSKLTYMLEKEESILSSSLSYSVENNANYDYSIMLSVKRNLLVIADMTKVSQAEDVFKERDCSLFSSYVSEIGCYYKSKNLSKALGGLNVGVSECDIHKRDIATDLMFEYLCGAFFLSSDEYCIVLNAIKGDEVSDREKALIVSALTLSLFREFDSFKIKILAECAGFADDSVVSVRAKVGLVLVSYLYNERIKLYPDIHNVIIRTAKSDAEFFAEIYMQLLRSKYTGKKGSALADLSNAIVNDKSLTDKIKDCKLEISTDDEVFSKISDKVGNLFSSQNKGYDVNFASNMYLNRSAFFSKPYIYFLPFSLEESAFTDLYGEDVLQNQLKFFFVYSNAYLCDVDKFHTVLSLKNMNGVMDKVMAKMDNSIVKNIAKPLDEIAVSRKDCMRNYIFSLFRFYYFHNSAGVYKNPFASSLQMYRLDIYKDMSKASVSEITNLHYENEEYADIVSVIENYKEFSSSEQFLKKAGISKRLLGEYSQAAELLEKALLIKERVSTLLTLAECYRMSGRMRDSLKCLKSASELSPDDIALKVKLAEAYVDLDCEKEAIDLLMFLDYELSERVAQNALQEEGESAGGGEFEMLLKNVRAKFLVYEESLARKYILAGDLDSALPYLNHINGHFSVESTLSDKLLALHIKMSEKGYKEAKTDYLALVGADTGALCECFEKDREILLALGVSAELQSLYLNDLIISLSANSPS